ncbi:class I SAM-dependent methyltransferase [Desulfobaculum bizertense]|uniref:Methyltransferase domain-containing protein n=1 Tax=Desulfobaculum bizertense DSM 18034 TaxID=1121442 RepID=A0A1T4VF01_9BACT|nr:class I SAM-dependent methyltransferase [Desulfobaculum bizertense]SKA63101.1 Methyltransferase domain-containing protein [Desulfobaculum bizertense DSM 18034]
MDSQCVYEKDHDEYGTVARVYDACTAPFLRENRELLAATVRSAQGPFLDICCGTGLQLVALDAAPHLQPIIGIDLSAAMLQKASPRASQHGFSLVQGNAGQLPFPPASFGIVALSFALHEKVWPCALQLVRSAFSVLRPSGLFITTDYLPRASASSWGFFLSAIIERAAGLQHFRNWQDYHRRGALGALIREARLPSPLRPLSHHVFASRVACMDVFQKAKD